MGWVILGVILLGVASAGMARANYDDSNLRRGDAYFAASWVCLVVFIALTFF